MKAKKVINTIVPLRIFSSKNMSSFGLVALFFLLYLIAGGGIGTKSLKAVRNSHINHGFGSASEQPYIQPRPPVRPQEERRAVNETAKTKENVDPDWERLNNKLKGISGD